jgi:hypothetical protein
LPCIETSLEDFLQNLSLESYLSLSQAIDRKYNLGFMLLMKYKDIDIKFPCFQASSDMLHQICPKPKYLQAK